MSYISGGSVTYLRRVKTGEYEHKEASASISFSQGEGEVDISSEAAQLALTRVNETLGIGQPAPATGVAKPATAQPEPGTAGAEAPKPTQRRGSRKPPAVETQAPPAGGQEADPFAEGSTSQSSAGQSTVGSSSSQPSTQSTTPAGGEGNGFDDDLFSPPQPEINDKDLVAAVFAHNQKVNNGPAIRELIGKYVVAPKGARDIPQELRAKFLLELVEIGKPSGQ